MIYLGMWQERCGKIVSELSQEGDYLYVDRLVSLLRQQPDGASIAELLLPSVLSEQISLIAECSEAELERCQRRFPAVVSAFQIVRLKETPPGEMIVMLKQYQAKKSQQIEIHPAGLKRLMQHLTALQRDLLFPGKGVRFLDWLNQDSPAEKHRLMYPKDVSAAFSRFSGLPLALIADEMPAGAETHAKALRSRVIGQDEACSISAQMLAQFKAGLNDPEKPVGTLLFVGPTGVGKTELAKQLARYMFGDEKRMFRLDMSEFMLPGSAARLLDVGQGVTSLAQQVRQQPLSLVLFDEIEKADSEVFDLLLGVLGEGRLTDALGSLVDFRMTVIIMTSNLGVSNTQAVGFGDSGGQGFVRSVRQHFRPEFFNRIDRVIAFKPLLRQDVLAIVDLELEKAGERTGLKRRNLRLVVDADARGWLAETGHHPTLGARPLKRLIEERVIAPVAATLARSPGVRDRAIPVVRAGTSAEQNLTVDEREIAVVVG
jgi:ATP-dependent Clp protease ATP-binding subunit ClpC